jgi:CubicO group peptidase (beta-lactamase class C family)
MYSRFLQYAVFTVSLASTFVLAAAETLPRGDAKEAGFSPEKLQQVDEVLQTAVKKQQIAGGAALIVRGGRIVHLATVGLADVENNVPIREETIYRIASMTKPITSVAVMMLVEQGKLRLDDPLSKFVPEFKDVKALVSGAKTGQPIDTITEPVATPITVHHLLSHTSGISYTLFDRPILARLYQDAGVSDGLIEMPGTIGDNVRRLSHVPLLFQPGAGWEYGLNTDVLGRVVEVASGQTLDAFFRDRIFQPLRMTDTHFILPTDKRSRLAALYAPEGPDRLRRVAEGVQKLGTLRYSATYPLESKSRYFSGGAGLVSTIGDYARFLQMLANRGELDGVRLLKPETVALMTRNQIGDHTVFLDGHCDKFGYGFGIVTEAGRSKDGASVGTYSWGGIFQTYFFVDPGHDVVALLMTQLAPFSQIPLREDFRQAVYGALVSDR